VSILDCLRRRLGKAGGKSSLVVRPVPDEGNPLWRCFSHNKGRVIHKWHHYFDIYHNHFQRFRGQPVTILEIGVFQGGSLQMWKKYFGPNAKIYGVDIDPHCKQLEEDQIQIFIGDQANREFISELKQKVGHIDIVIDDGGHTMIQQVTTFKELFPIVRETGIYLVEDLHTSYWEEFGGGYKVNGSFVEYAKGFIDSINAWHSRDPELVPDNITKSVTGIHFYDSVLVIEKYPNGSKPIQSMTGNESELAAIQRASEHATSEE
jgi:Methyltransferase domain